MEKGKFPYDTDMSLYFKKESSSSSVVQKWWEVEAEDWSAHLGLISFVGFAPLWCGAGGAERNSKTGYRFYLCSNPYLCSWGVDWDSKNKVLNTSWWHDGGWAQTCIFKKISWGSLSGNCCSSASKEVNRGISSVKCLLGGSLKRFSWLSHKQDTQNLLEGLCIL